jgi:hypothetical protein
VKEAKNAAVMLVAFIWATLIVTAVLATLALPPALLYLVVSQ